MKKGTLDRFWKNYRRLIVALLMMPVTVPFVLISHFFEYITRRLWRAHRKLDSFFDWLSRDEE